VEGRIQKTGLVLCEEMYQTFAEVKGYFGTPEKGGPAEIV
jgi:hypothetical protein